MAQDGEGSEATAPGYYALTLPDAGRRYTLVIPDGYTGQEAAPLIISLHYGGGVTPKTITPTRGTHAQGPPDHPPTVENRGPTPRRITD